MHSHCLRATPRTDKEPNLTSTVQQGRIFFFSVTKKREARSCFGFPVPPCGCQMRSSAACRGHGGRTITLIPPLIHAPCSFKAMHTCLQPPPPSGHFLHSSAGCSQFITFCLYLFSYAGMQSPSELARTRHALTDVVSP